jgi:hypothetical protein
MSNAGLETTITREEAFDADDLQSLRAEARKMVERGALPLEAVSLDGHLDDGQQLADGENEAFREAVAAELDDMPAREPTNAPQEREAAGEGWTADDVVFKTIWDEFNFSKTVSRTQLEGALECSDHTSLGTNGAGRAIEAGVERGEIVDIPRETAALGTDETQTQTGVLYARGWSE